MKCCNLVLFLFLPTLLFALPNGPSTFENPDPPDDCSNFEEPDFSSCDTKTSTSSATNYRENQNSDNCETFKEFKKRLKAAMLLALTNCPNDNQQTSVQSYNKGQSNNNEQRFVNLCKNGRAGLGEGYRAACISSTNNQAEDFCREQYEKATQRSCHCKNSWESCKDNCRNTTVVGSPERLACERSCDDLWIDRDNPEQDENGCPRNLMQDGQEMLEAGATQCLKDIACNLGFGTQSPG